jgi:alkyl sulfatase BDS1-like metallo-beta-lactamase superfamily hydrolase
MAWWKVINDAIKLFANDTDVIFAQHHWPIWRDDSDLVGYLKKQRDLYKYLLDQSLRMLNHGHMMIVVNQVIFADSNSNNPNPTEFDAMVKGGRVHVQGDREKVMAILALLDMFPANFNIVTP